MFIIKLENSFFVSQLINLNWSLLAQDLCVFFLSYTFLEIMALCCWCLDMPGRAWGLFLLFSSCFQSLLFKCCPINSIFYVQVLDLKQKGSSISMYNKLGITIWCKTLLWLLFIYTTYSMYNALWQELCTLSFINSILLSLNISWCLSVWIKTRSKNSCQFVFFTMDSVDVHSFVVLCLEILVTIQTSILSSLDVSCLNMIDNCLKVGSTLFADGTVGSICF